MLKRKPDRIINENYLLRWYIIPRNRYFNIFLHCFLGSDDDRAMHDHPWWSVSFLLKGRIAEIQHAYNDRFNGQWLKFKTIYRFLPVIRSAKHTHRIELLSDKAWTLFITGPVIRSWGFHCPKGWVPWRDFTDASGNSIGKGCD